VRVAIIECMPLLASQLGHTYFDEKLGGMCIGWLQDCVFAIREAAISNLRKLIEIFGPEWARRVVQQVLEAHQHPNYLYRMTVLYAIVAIAPAVGPELLSGTLLPVAILLAADPVPNVRFQVAKTLRQLLPMLEPATVLEHVKPCLAMLVDDPDHDVRYFASQGMQG